MAVTSLQRQSRNSKCNTPKQSTNGTLAERLPQRGTVALGLRPESNRVLHFGHTVQGKLNQVSTSTELQQQHWAGQWGWYKIRDYGFAPIEISLAVMPWPAYKLTCITTTNMTNHGKPRCKIMMDLNRATGEVAMKSEDGDIDNHDLENDSQNTYAARKVTSRNKCKQCR